MSSRWLTAILLAALAPAAPAAAAPACLTPVAADGHEPPCNPHAGSAVWSASHRGAFAQGSSPFPAPRPGDAVSWQRIPFAEVPVLLQFGEPYPDGGRAVWTSTVGVPNLRRVYKLDAATGAVIDTADLADEGRPPAEATTSGVYNLLDADNRFFTVRDREIAVYTDARPGEHASPIALEQVWALPERAFCGPGDRLIGVTLTHAGRLAFVTVEGVVGTVPRRRLDDAHLRVSSIGTARCSGAETVANSLAADDAGGIFVVSTHAQYRFDQRGPELRQTWRAEYTSGGGDAGSTLSSGSGSTPDVVGTDPDDDRFVVITDGASLMHVVFFWRDRIPRDWEPIAPGKDRRIACEVPITFGDPAATASVSEQSVLTRGYSAYVVNNALPLDRLYTLIPPERRPLSTLTSNLAGPHGMERVDWDPRTRTCRSVWANREVSIPNAVPTLSTDSGLVYGVGVRAAVWGLEGLDMDTGEPRLWVPTTPLPTENSFFAATTVGPDGAIWVGGIAGIDVFRGPVRPAPALECKEFAPPRARVVRARHARGRLRVRGRASDRGCAGVRRVQVRAGGRLLRARGREVWRLSAAIDRRRVTVRARAIDREGNRGRWSPGVEVR